MIVKSDALTAQRFHHVRETQAGGRQCYRVRRNGATQTWVTRPADFRIPVKHGLRDYGQITDGTASDWNVADALDVCARCAPGGVITS